MKFIEWTVHTTTAGSDLVADVLWDHTNYGVTVCDINDVIALQSDKRTFWDYMDDDLAEQAKSAGDVLVKCYLPVDIADAEIAKINAELSALRERGAGFIDFGTFETGPPRDRGGRLDRRMEEALPPAAHRAAHRHLSRVDRLPAQAGKR